ncbi:4Fe-4S binding protein [archaeon]
MIGGVVDKPGSLDANKTGGWRSFRPIIDREKCIGCGICKKFCPDVCIEIIKGKSVVDYDYCKGCLICKNLCPVKAISSEEEEK